MAAKDYQPRHDLVKDKNALYMEKPGWTVSEDDMAMVMRIMERMGWVEEYAAKVVSDKGRKRSNCNFEGLIAAMTMNVVLLGKAPHLDAAAVTLYEVMPLKWRRRFHSDRYTRPTPKRRKAAVKSVERLWKKFRLLIDSQPMPMNRRLTEDELKEAVALFPDPEDAAKMDAALLWICNQITGATCEIALDTITPGWRTAETRYGMDATHFKANAKPYSKRKKLCSFDAQAGWYKRDHDEPPDEPIFTKDGAPIRKRQAADRTKDILEWAYEAHIMRLCVNPYSDYRDQIEVPVGFSVDRPAVAPDINALRAVDGALATGLPPGVFAFDSAYQKEPFLQGCMDRGFGVLFDPFASLADHHQSYKGSRIVGGRPCCPGVEPTLLQINNDYHSKKIETETMFARAAQIDAFRAWQKDKTPDGELRFVCPARAPHDRKPQCNCPLLDQPYTDGLPEVPFPPSMEMPTSEDGDPHRRDLQSPGDLCTKGSIVVDPKELVMVWQEHAHRSSEWRALYAAGRNATERGHSRLKAGYTEALNMPDRRGLKGRANVFLMSAFILAAQTMRVMRSWLRNADRDKNGVIIAPPLKHRRGTGRRPWHSKRPPLVRIPKSERLGPQQRPPDPPEELVVFS